MSFVTVAAGLSIGMGVNSLMGNPLGLGGGGQAGQQAQQMVDPFAPYRASYAQALNQYMGLGVGGPTGGAPGVGGGIPMTAPTPGMAGPTGVTTGTRHSRVGALNQYMSGGGTAPSIPGVGTPTGTSLPPGQLYPGGISPTYGLNDPAYQAALDIGLQGVQRRNPGASGNALLELQKYGVTYQDQFSQSMFNQLAMLSGASTSPYAGGMAGLRAADAASANQSQGVGMMMSGIQNLFRAQQGTNPDLGVGMNLGQGAYTGMDMGGNIAGIASSGMAGL